jgi:hypothetical protein
MEYYVPDTRVTKQTKKETKGFRGRRRNGIKESTTDIGNVK